jgi:hypothetical protein
MTATPLKISGSGCMALLRGLRQTLWALPLLTFAACSGVGKGDKLERLVLVTKSTAVVLTPPVLAYQCLRQGFGVYGVFGKNGSADYTDRPSTHWTSSNPEIVRVSDGINPDPVTGVLYAKGVITPVRPGTATITAEYVGVTTSVNVEVRVPDGIIISTSAFDSSAAAGTISIAPGSIQKYYAYARLKDESGNVVPADVSAYPRWSIPDDPDGARAKISSVAVVSGVGAGGPVTINANFDACPGSTFENVSAKLAVSNINQLTLQHEAGFSAANPLVIGTTEAFKINALLNNGDNQDLSLQSVLSTPESVVQGATQILSVGLGNVAGASAVGTTKVTASFGASPNNTVTSAPLAVSTQNATLTGFAIDAADRNLSIAPRSFHDHYHAIGTYAPTLGGPAFQQDISRHVTWSSGNAATVFLSNIISSAGLALSTSSNPSCVSVTAALSADTSKSDSTKLGIGVPVNSSNCP